jgi:deoxyxylulose-5-phosphate synthase
VLEALAEHKLADRFLAALAMPDAIVDHGPQATFRKIWELDAAGIAARTLELLNHPGSGDTSAEGALASA